MKLFLLEQDGIEARSPKAVVKEFFLAGHVNQQHDESLVQMIDDRNTLSHLYADHEFDRIIRAMQGYISTMVETLNQLKQLRT
jgi:uncharacterized protein YutE (UPF0331/DUF86 family)